MPRPVAANTSRQLVGVGGGGEGELKRVEWRARAHRWAHYPEGTGGFTAATGRSMLAKALRHLRNQEERLTYFLSDGRIPIHNNLAELQARHIAVGRKGWIFFGSEDGAEAGSVWLSLVLSARMHNLDVQDYLRDLFRVLPAWPKHRVLELAPHRWAVTRARIRSRCVASSA